MKALLLKFWNDEQFFLRWMAFLVFGMGSLIARGKIPTFIDGLGQQLGPIVEGFAVMIATGNLKIPQIAESTITQQTVETTIVQQPLPGNPTRTAGGT